jgi:hypothetical protein
LFAYARHLCGAVEDRNEGGIEPVIAIRTATIVSSKRGLQTELVLPVEALPEALRGRIWAERRGRQYSGGMLRVVSPEEVEKGIWFRHGGCAGMRVDTWRVEIGRAVASAS